MKKQIPNLITCSRLLFFGFIVVLLINGEFSFKVGFETIHIVTNYHLITACYFFGAMTDILDGALARKWHIESNLGDILDHTIDKIFVLPAGYILFKHLLGIPFGILAVLELVTVAVGIKIYLQKRKNVETKKFPNIFGKVAYGFLIGSVCVLLLAVKWPPYWPAFSYLANASLVIAICLRIVSLAKYVQAKT